MFARSTVFRLAIFLFLCIAASLSALSQQSGPIVVVSIAGDWKYNDKRLTFGQSLPSTDCIYATDGSVVLRSDTANAGPQPFVCEKPSRDSQCRGFESDRCAVPLDPTRWTKSGTAASNLWASVTHLLTGDPEKYMVAASRGIEPGLEDTVVLLQGQSVDLAAAFLEMAAGHYWMQVSSTDGQFRPVNTFELQFAPHHPAVISGSSLHPGVYRVVLVDKSGSPAGSDCWILISAVENYSSTSRAFQDALRDSQSWPEGMDPSATRALLRVYLESLAISSGKKQP